MNYEIWRDIMTKDRKKRVYCPECKKYLIYNITEENIGTGPLFSLACLHQDDTRVLIATFDKHLAVRKAKCHELQRS